MAAKALLLPSSSSPLGVGWGGVALSWFPDGTGGGGTWGWEARHPEQRDLVRVSWSGLAASLAVVVSLSLSQAVSVTCSSPFPKAAWVGGSGSR